MSVLATAANAAWCASSTPSYLAFRSALKNPRHAQLRLLRQYVSRNARTAFGREHRFDSIHDLDTFRRRVPVRHYDEIAPWVDRVVQGEQQVLTSEQVIRLMPSSGSTRASKLIPYTAGLQREFNRAIAPWIVDLFRNAPDLLRGSAYWSISPISTAGEQARKSSERSHVPIGFDEDSAYLGGVRQWLVNSVMAVPSTVRHSPDLRTFQFAALSHLIRRRDLRLISVWHPSFLELLLEAAADLWNELLEGMSDDDAARAAELRRVGPSDWRAIWPHLTLISCWADGFAAEPADALRRRFQNVLLQPKGLLATEAFVSIPFHGKWPLAIRSHFFEFEDERGEILLAHELRPGSTYAAIVTTAGGLWRYKLGDLVRCDDMLGGTPSVRFVGRHDLVVDHFGEKLSEGFVASAIRDALAAAHVHADFAMLAPDGFGGDSRISCYTLFVSTAHNVALAPQTLSALLDETLRRNPHYAWCRNLGQLGVPRLFRVRGGAHAAFIARAAESGRRLGEIKPVALDGRADWSARFKGEYVSS